MKKTEKEIRREFGSHYLALLKTPERRNSDMSMEIEWDKFIKQHIERGELPASAGNWKL